MPLQYPLNWEDPGNLTGLYAPMYAPACMIQRLPELQKPGTGRREAGGVWWAVYGGRHVAYDVWQMAAKIIMLVDIIV